LFHVACCVASIPYSEIDGQTPSPNSMKWLYCSAALAALGLALSVASHIEALQGNPGPLGKYTWTLHLGALAICIPAAIVARKSKWKALLAGCPAWMRYVLYGFITYAIVNFAIFMVTPHGGGSPGLMPPAVVRGFSGHWMAIYAAAFAVLYSGVKARPWGGPPGPRPTPTSARP
jgi:hypothetical protein